MVKYVILFVAFCVVFAKDEQCHILGYYWKDFDGDVPEDALLGGTLPNKTLIYIAQVFHQGWLIPGQIYFGNRMAYYEFNSQIFTATENIKILCTFQPKHLQWVATTKIRVKHLIDEYTLIIAGYQKNYFLYIGRQKLGSRIMTGKVITHQDEAGFRTVSDGKVVNLEVFEVLTYNPEE